MHWSWFSFVVGLLVGSLASVGVAKLKALISKA